MLPGHQPLSRRDPPELGRLIIAAGHDPLTVATESDRVHLLRVRKRFTDGVPCVGVPESGCLVVASRQRGPAIGTKGQVVDVARVRKSHATGLFCGYAP